jgi:hypothetical protein
MSRIFFVGMAFFALYACGEKNEAVENTTSPVTDSVSESAETERAKADSTRMAMEDMIEEDLANKIVVYKNNRGHELRLEIMGQNHETLWYYNDGETEIQVIPQIGENDYYALQTNEGQNIGFMQLNKINEGNDFRIAAEIEVTINKDNQKSIFKRSDVIE